MHVVQSADDELTLQTMKAELEKAESELQVKTTELDKLKDELNTMRHDSEVCVEKYYIAFCDLL